MRATTAKLLPLLSATKLRLIYAGVMSSLTCAMISAFLTYSENAKANLTSLKLQTAHETLVRESNSIRNEVILGQQAAVSKRIDEINKQLLAATGVHAICIEVFTANDLVASSDQCKAMRSRFNEHLASLQIEGSSATSAILVTVTAIPKPGSLNLDWLQPLLFLVLSIVLITVMFELYVFRPVQRHQADLATHKDLYTFAQMTAHDLRKPLTMAKTLISIANSAKSSTEVQDIMAHYALKTLRQIHHAESLLEDLLHDQRASDLRVQPHSLLSLIREAAGSHEQEMTEKRIQFSICQNIDFTIQLDYQKMSRVTANLMRNAVDHCPPGGKIQASVASKLDWVIIDLANEGKPIPEATLRELFKPFATFGKKSGTGLGLLIAKTIVSAHGGEIMAFNDFDRDLVVFRIKLPIPVSKGRSLA